jgi:hypothetical protein
MFFNLRIAGSRGCERAEKQSYEQGGGEKLTKVFILLRIVE